MKKIITTMVSLSLLTGCVDYHTISKKIPFLNNQESPMEKDDEKKENGEEAVVSQPDYKDNDLVLESIFFNETKEVDGKNVIQNPNNILVMVNKDVTLPADYIPSDLTRPKTAFTFSDQTLEKGLIRKEAAAALENMFINAKKQGIELIAASGYRSYERQELLFDAEVARVGQEKAIQAVAIPGQSEHQTGLAMDIASRSSNLQLTEEFGQTNEGRWLAQHAHEYGYIVRYPKGKENITGYQYEPWHFRYVGIKAAKVIFEKSCTLEEYFNLVKKI